MGDEHGVAVGGVGDRGFRHAQRRRVGFARDPDAGEHAGGEQAFGVVQQGLDLHRARLADQRVDGADARREAAPRIGVDQDLEGLAELQLGAGAFVQGEIAFQGPRIHQAGHRLGDAEVLAEVHAADAELAGEGRADRLLVDQRLGLAHRAERHVAGGDGVVQLFLRGDVALYQLARTGMEDLGIAQLRLETDQLGLFHRVVELHQQLPLLHLLARFEGDAGDPSCRFGGHLDLATGLQPPTPSKTRGTTRRSTEARATFTGG